MRRNRYAPIRSALKTLGFLSILFITRNAYSQAILTQSELQVLANQVQPASGAPGVVVTLLDSDNRITVASGLRAASPAPASQMLPTDRLMIGSNFKAMTATVVGRLVDKGQLRWDSSMEEIFPDLAPSMHSSKAKVTIQQLLAHRGGMHDPSLSAAVAGFSPASSSSAMRSRVLPTLLQQTPQVSVGNYSYSNIGYAVVGAAIERTTSKSFDAVLKEELIDPLGMNSLVVGAPGSNSFSNITGPLGHDENGNPILPENQIQPLGLEPAGFYSVNSEDWSKFAGLMAGISPETGYLSDESLAHIQTPFGEALEDGDFYGMGISILESSEGHTLLGHSGSNGSWYSTMLVNKDLGRAVMVSGNQQIGGFLAVQGVIGDERIDGWINGKPSSVPEPASLLGLFSLGLFGLLNRRNRPIS